MTPLLTAIDALKHIQKTMEDNLRLSKRAWQKLDEALEVVNKALEAK